MIRRLLGSVGGVDVWVYPDRSVILEVLDEPMSSLTPAQQKALSDVLYFLSRNQENEIYQPEFRSHNPEFKICQ